MGDGLGQAAQNGLYGVVSMKDGHLIVPCEYDSIAYSVYGGSYIHVIKDGKFGFVNTVTGELTYLSSYVESVVSDYCQMATVQDLNGEYIVLTPMGELPEHYSEVKPQYFSSSESVVVRKDDKVGLVDWSGNQLIPLDGTYSDIYQLSMSKDGSVVVGCTMMDSPRFIVYKISH